MLLDGNQGVSLSLSKAFNTSINLNLTRFRQAQPDSHSLTNEIARSILFKIAKYQHLLKGKASIIIPKQRKIDV